MKAEQLLGRIEDFFERSLNIVNESIIYNSAESVGTIRTLDVFRSLEFGPKFDTVVLDFGIPMESGEWVAIDRVPHGIIKRYQSVEIFVKRNKFHSEDWLTSLRPFNYVLYGKPFVWDEANLGEIFSYNLMDSKTHKLFFNKFLKDR